MFNIEYEEWKNACEYVSSYGKYYGKYYMQIYPFFRHNNLDKISSNEYFNKYIKTGYLFLNKSNFEKIDNYTRKKDGSYRNRYLITPIMYLYYIALGIHIFNIYNVKRNDEIYVEYAGDFKNKNLHYKDSYKRFVNNLKNISKDYKYFFKIDIADYFNKIDINILSKMISDCCPFSEREQFCFINFLNFLGNGRFPQTECGTTSSFLSTVIYFEKIDNKLYKFLENINEIKKFKICRYVDDLYIFIDMDGRRKTDKLENMIISKYEDIIYEFKLSINKDKSHFEEINKLSEFLQELSLVDLYDEEYEIDESYKKSLKEFLSKLCSLSENNSLNFNQYNELKKEYFLSKNDECNISQIFYIILYTKLDWLKDTLIIKRLNKIIDKDFNVLLLDSSKFVPMILNTKDDILINNFLNKLYITAEEGKWLNAHNYLVYQYLLRRSFVSVKLINEIKQYYPNIISFIKMYYKDDWRKNIINFEIENKINKLSPLNNNLAFFKFMENITILNNSMLEAQTYNKSYFDIITFMIENKKNMNTNNKMYYQKKELKKIYKENLNISDDLWNVILNTCNNRNDNPLCHANCNIFKNKANINKKIKDDIEEINNVIEQIIQNYL